MPSARSVLRLQLGTDDLALNETDLEARRQVLLFRQELLHYHLSAKASFVAGHVPFSPPVHRDFHASHRFITILRDPVARFVSQYHYSRRVGAPRPMREPLGEDLVAKVGRLWGVTSVEFLSGLPSTADLRSREAIERARENLRSFEVVGIAEEMAQFAAALSGTLGLPIRIPRVNVSPRSPEEPSQVTPEALALIREACAPDIEVYRYARSLALPGDRPAPGP